jgi:DNA replication protein DnaC
VSRAKIISDLVRADARELKMPGVAKTFEALARQAGTEGWSPIEYLHEVLATEITSRAESAVRARLRNARFPEQKTLGEFDFDAAAGIESTRLAELAGGAFIERGDNVIFAGPIGTGKTHLAIALGVEAAGQRRHVAFYRAADLVSALREARDNRALGRLRRRTQRVELLILDEVGFVPFDRAGGELLFNLLADRYQARRSVIVTTNLSFAEWPKVFGGDEKLTTALLDRLAENATVIATKGKSYRMRKRHAEADPTPPIGQPAEMTPAKKTKRRQKG